MLEILNSLSLFFEDCYRRVSVREYSRLMNISPPTASILLKKYAQESLLKKEMQFRHLFFSAHRENKTFVDLSQVYWSDQLKEVVALLERTLVVPTAILFGSLSKGEAKKDSDIDLAVFAPKKKIPLEQIEKKLKRNIQLFWYESLSDIKNKGLQNNILNGHLLLGRLEL